MYQYKQKNYLVVSYKAEISKSLTLIYTSSSNGNCLIRNLSYVLLKDPES